jgi:hypothetical protein
MAKKKPETQEVNPAALAKIAQDVTAMNIYDCQLVLEELNALAAQNDGELTDEQLEIFVATQTQSIVKLGKLVGAIKYIEQGCEYCKSEENRIAENRRKAENRLESIKRYLTPYVKQQGKIILGTFTLSTRISKAVEILDPNFNDPFFCKINSIKNPSDKVVEAARAEASEGKNEIMMSPDKKAIKEILESGEAVPGCELVERDNLQIK